MNFSEDGSKLTALSPTSITLWDVNKGIILKEFHQAHESKKLLNTIILEQITGQLIKKDNKTLITGSLDGRIRFWDLNNKSLIYGIESVQKSKPKYTH